MKRILYILFIATQTGLTFGQSIQFLTDLNCRSLRGGIECLNSSYIGVGVENSFEGYDTTYCFADCDPDNDTIITEIWRADFYLVKVNKFGDTLWSKQNGGSGADWIEDIKAINDDYIITGYSSSNSNGHYDFYVSRIDSIGESIWHTLLGGAQSDRAFSSVVCSNDNIFSIGSTKSFGYGRNGSEDIYLVKYSSSGDTLFTKTFGDSVTSETGVDIIQTSDENLVILANSNNDNHRELVVIKINNSGDIIWSQQYIGNYISFQIIEDGQNNLIITGTKKTFGENYDEDLFLLKLTPNGDSIWEQSYGDFRENGYFLNTTSDNNYIISGSTGGVNGGQSDVGLFKISQSGELLWKRSFNLSTGNEDWGSYVKQAVDGGYVIIGTKGLGGSYILKTDENGYLTSITDSPTLTKTIKVFPIPFRNNLMIRNYSNETYNCLIYSIDGSLISTLKVSSGENEYDFTHLYEGTYIYRIIDKAGKPIDSGKVIKSSTNL